MILRSHSALCLLAAAGTATADEDFDAGQYLVDKCSRCHDSTAYTRPSRRVQSLQALDAQVRRCDSMLESKLFEDDIKSLVEYLNGHYYHF